MSTLEETISQLETERDEANTKVQASEKALADKTSEFDELQANFKKMKEDEKKKARCADLLEAGLSAEEAEAQLDMLASLSDEAFASVVALLSKGAESTQTETEETGPLARVRRRRRRRRRPRRCA